MPIKIAASTSILRYYPIELAAKVIKENEYEGIEIWGGAFHGYYMDALVTEGDLKNRVLNLETLNRLRRIIDAYKLELTCYTPEQCIYPVNYLVKDIEPFDFDKIVKKAVNIFCLCADIAAHLCCERLLVTTPAWFFKKDSANNYIRIENHENLKNAIETLGRIIEYAESKSIRVQLEPLTWLETNALITMEDVKYAVVNLPKGKYDLLIDLGHENVTARRLGVGLCEYLDRYFQEFGDMIKYIHVDDNEGLLDSHLIPGDGSIDFRAVFNVLKKNGFSGWLSVELSMFGEFGIPPFPEKAIRRAREVILESLS